MKPTPPPKPKKVSPPTPPKVGGSKPFVTPSQRPQLKSRQTGNSMTVKAKVK